MSIFLVLPVSVQPPCHAQLLSSVLYKGQRRLDTSLLCRSSCRAENKNLSRRYHRKAEAKGIKKPCSWLFVLKMILENSPKALRWQTSSFCKGCSALQHGEAWNHGGAKLPSDIVYSKGLSKCGPLDMGASASLGNLSKMYILRLCSRLAESESLGKRSRDPNAYSSVRIPAAHIPRSMSIWCFQNKMKIVFSWSIISSAKKVLVTQNTMSVCVHTHMHTCGVWGYRWPSEGPGQRSPGSWLQWPGKQSQRPSPRTVSPQFVHLHFPGVFTLDPQDFVEQGWASLDLGTVWP